MTESLVYHETEKLTPCLWRKRRKDGRGAYYAHWCPGCKHCHSYPVGDAFTTNWTFDGNVVLPSFRPSMRIYIPERRREDGTVIPEYTTCHYYLIDGILQYQGDCRHEYSGKTIPMEPIPEDYGF